MLKSMETLVALCKNRGFIYPGSEIYGGLANTWDYGPLGNELKNNVSTKFDMLLDVTAIDYLSEKHLMEVVYFLYSNENKSRVRLKIQLNEKELSCQTVTSVWESANWYERETFDMYGVNFIGHPDLRRFYMPDDFTDPISGEAIHPLRKDFPLAGISDSLPLPPYPEKYGEIK